MGIVLSIYIGILGLIIGSFLNVVIYRFPLGESIVVPPSHCTSCGHKLKFWELVPVLSFIFLRRRCSQCNELISWRYPFIELLTGSLFFYATWQNFSGSWLSLVLKLIFISLLIVLAGIDYDTFRLPDIFTFPLIIIGLANGFLSSIGPTPWESIASGLGTGFVFGLIAWLYPKGMGLGDVKLVVGLGAFLGFPEILLAILIASFTGSVIGIIRLVANKRGFRDQIPFGPYLVFGALVTLFWGEGLIDLYFSLLF